MSSAARVFSVLADDHEVDLKALLGASGILLMIMGTVIMFSNVGLTVTPPVTYYYAATGITYNIKTFTPSENGTVVNLTVATVDVKVKATIPSGVNVSVWIPPDPLTTSQIIALGATDPSQLGHPYLLLDIIVTWTPTTTPPTVEIAVEVPRPDVVAFYWNSTLSQWLKFPTQEIRIIDGKTFLVLIVTKELKGTPFSFIVPVGVGGILENTTSGVNKVGLVVMGLGALLIATAAGLYYLERIRARQA